MSSNGTVDLVCFDVDGTLVRHPRDKIIWEVLNQRFMGTDAINVERYRMYVEGAITYAQWVELDVQGWIDAGANRDQVLAAVSEFQPCDGIRETAHELKRRGVRLAIISGTLDIVIDTLFPDHVFDDVYSNRLIFDESGKLAGWEATPYDQHGKPDALREISRRHQLSLERSVFVGDGDNDVPVIGVAGRVIAFNPRSRELERRADHVIRGNDMRELLAVLE